MLKLKLGSDDSGVHDMRWIEIAHPLHHNLGDLWCLHGQGWHGFLGLEKRWPPHTPPHFVVRGRKEALAFLGRVAARVFVDD